MSNGGSASPPVHQPAPLPQQPAPTPAAGVNHLGLADWFLKFTNMREFANGDHFELVKGLRLTLAILAKIDLAVGWYHTSVVGGSYTRIRGQDLKLNLGGYVGFIALKKEEITRGEKVARVFAGVKISLVHGTKTSVQGTNEVSSSAVQKAELLNRSADYWAVKEEVERTLREHIQNLKRDHAVLEETITKLQQELNHVEITASQGKVEGSSQILKSNTIVAQCENVKQQAKANFEILADASAELLASAKWEGYCRGDVKLMASGLQKFAASITKLG